MNKTALRFATFMGSASILTLATVLGANAQQAQSAMQAQAASGEVSENVLVTGSLIHGAADVGVPVTSLTNQDFTESGSVTVGDLFHDVPQVVTYPGASNVTPGGHQEREQRINIRGLDLTGPRDLLLVDGVRYPPQASGLCAVDPSIIPALALDRVDVLTDGASAVYGSDAITGVVNLILKRGFDGAMTEVHVSVPTDGGGPEYQEAQIWGRTWDGGDVTLTYEHIDSEPTPGTVHSDFTLNYAPWGVGNEIPIGSSSPGVVSTGAPSVTNGIGQSGLGTICSNCYSVPKGTGVNFNSSLNSGVGPIAPSSAATLTWAQLTGDAGVTNEVDPLKYGDEVAAQQKNSFVVTFDQKLFPDVSFFFTGFYANRRVEMELPHDNSASVNNDIKTFTVPTTNPYYPTGAPAGLRVSYDLGMEYPPYDDAYELSERYQFGFNLDLPFDWQGKIYDSRSYEANRHVDYVVNDNAVSLALGGTVNNTVSGTTITVSKPSGLPYLNLFCDPSAFQCNSPQTLAFIGAQNMAGDVYQIEEKGAQFDGPLFDLPAGKVKAAFGGDYDSNNITLTSLNNSGVVPLSVVPGSTEIYGPIPADLNTMGPTVDPEPYTVWAVFTQLDIPIFGDNFNMPLFRKFDIEASWRHDQYNSPTGSGFVGGTNNPRVAFTWLVDDLVGATIRGSWGTSFRPANAGEYSIAAGYGTNAYDFSSTTGVTNAATIALDCGTQTGSFSAALVSSGFACGGTNNAPAGLTVQGGPQPTIRSFLNATTNQLTEREGGPSLAPETSINYSLGVEFAPTFDFLKGLDLQATYYSVRIDNPLQSFNQTTSTIFDASNQRFHFILPSDLGCTAPNANQNPTACAPFEAMVLSILNGTGSNIAPSQASNVYWISDGGTFGSGFIRVEGIDFNGSYNFDLGNYGSWQVGVTGNYQLHRYQQTVSGGTVIDQLDQNIAAAGGVAQNGVETGPRMTYRARLGWTDGTYNATLFMNYSSHFFSPWGSPTNVNLQCTTSGGTVGGGSLPCAIDNFTTLVPAYYTFDLNFGYNTGDKPENEYLRNLDIEFTVQDLFGRYPAFEYGPVTSAREVAAYNILQSNAGRVIGLTLTKHW